MWWRVGLIVSLFWVIEKCAIRNCASTFGRVLWCTAPTDLISMRALASTAAAKSVLPIHACCVFYSNQSSKRIGNYSCVLYCRTDWFSVFSRSGRTHCNSDWTSNDTCFTLSLTWSSHQAVHYDKRWHNYCHSARCSCWVVYLLALIIISPLVGKRSIVMTVSVCLSVREHIPGTTHPIFTKFLCVPYMAALDAWCTSGFIDDVIFAHSGRHATVCIITAFTVIVIPWFSCSVVIACLCCTFSAILRRITFTVYVRLYKC